MDKCRLEIFSSRMKEVWPIISLDQFANDVLLLTSFHEVIRNTVYLDTLPHTGEVGVAVTRDGDGEYCLWELAHLSEAYGMDAWFDSLEEATPHALQLMEYITHVAKRSLSNG